MIDSDNTGHPLAPEVWNALRQVMDPELGRSIADLGMIPQWAIDDANHVTATVLLTTEGCPLRARIVSDVEDAVGAVEGVSGVTVDVGVMDDEQRAAARRALGLGPGREIAFAGADGPTRVIAIASGKGGVGKSSITANLACVLADRGLSVGVVDADLFGFSIPDLLGATAEDRPTAVEGFDDLLLPPVVRGVKVVSMAMFLPDREQVVAWRGPMLAQGLRQFLADTYWGDLDVLLIDLPPGTGDIALSIGQLVPSAEIIVVTTPQTTAAQVAERAGTMAWRMKQKVIGVVENMSYWEGACPHCGQPHRVDLFGRGGGREVAARLSQRLGYEVPLLAEIPLERDWRAAGDIGVPLVTVDAEQGSGAAIVALAERLGLPRRA